MYLHHIINMIATRSFADPLPSELLLVPGLIFKPERPSASP
jgi:hypothetical protein